MTAEQWLGAESTFGIRIWREKYRQNCETFDEWLDRVSGGDSFIRKMILDKKFLFGGRVLANRGLADRKVSLFNCYVLPPPEDNLPSIFDTMKEMALTYARGGGVGTSLDKLSPKGAKINNAANWSTGAVSFMDLFSMTTQTIAQKGRRGALMLMLSVEHPDIMEFIESKQDLDRINYANISVKVTPEFMKAVKRDGEWLTEFTRPETGETISRTYRARDIMIKMAECAWNTGDPGVVYMDRMANYNLAEKNAGYVINSTNPCGEQGLPDYGCCNLGSINLSEFVDRPFTSDARINYSSLADAVRGAVSALDHIIDEGQAGHALGEQAEQHQKWRNIGLGVMGYADMLIKLGLRYGNEKANEFTMCLFRQIYIWALQASVELAITKSPYPNIDIGSIFQSDFWQTLNNPYCDCVTEFCAGQAKFTPKADLDKLRDLIQYYGMRNVTLLTVAPTGSTSSMIGVSGGCEPLFSTGSFTRTTKSIGDGDQTHVMYPQIVRDLMEAQGLQPGDPLPDYVVSAHDLTWRERLAAQAAMQTFVDTSISSTVNLPKSATVEDIYNLYVEAYDLGLKGITVFRDGCAKAGILSVGTDPVTEMDPHLARGEIVETNDDLIGLKRKLTTGCGSLHFGAFFDPKTGEVQETYLSKGSTGGCENYMKSLSRVISLAKRAGVSTEAIADQLFSCGNCPSYAVRKATLRDTSKGSCCPAAVGYALLDMRDEFNATQHSMPEPAQNVRADASNGGSCPSCKTPLVFTGGCNFCPSCGWSKCE